MTALAAALLAVDPGLGGIALRARAGPYRQDWLDWALALTGRPHRRLPVGASEERVFGGLDLAATLEAGRPVIAPGLLADLSDGTVVVPMAERLAPGIAARLAHVWDAGAKHTLIALDESDGDGGVPPALLERLAFHGRLEPQPLRDGAETPPARPEDIAAAQVRLPDITMPEEGLRALTGTAAALGVHSLRAVTLAVRAARAAAALAGEATAGLQAWETAAALVLAPRARQVPPAEADDPPPPPEPDRDAAAPQSQDSAKPPEDLVLEAAMAAIPPDLLARLAAAGALTRRGASAGAGDDRTGASRGRPAGHRRGDPRAGGRLDLVATLRAAAPWQPIRRRATGRADRVLVTADDFRLRRFKEQTEKVVIFAVDASGSAALTRLAETKGAIELMLAEAYVRRERVALIAFRGAAAEILLPPTRSLVQAKRRLAGLPGGGGTPLATGLEAALALSDRIARSGATPHLAVLTDGRANIARDGTPGRAQAGADATAMARAVRAAGIPALVLDTAPRPQAAARDLAVAMGAEYLPLPHGSTALARSLQSALDARRGAA